MTHPWSYIIGLSKTQVEALRLSPYSTHLLEIRNELCSCGLSSSAMVIGKWRTILKGVRNRREPQTKFRGKKLQEYAPYFHTASTFLFSILVSDLSRH
jgi:hypothetical protein